MATLTVREVVDIADAMKSIDPDSCKYENNANDTDKVFIRIEPISLSEEFSNDFSGVPSITIRDITLNDSFFFRTFDRSSTNAFFELLYK